MDEPFCLGGRLISPIIVLGPEDISLRSFEILDKFIALIFKLEDSSANESRLFVSSIKSFGLLNLNPEICESVGIIISNYFQSTFMPVPIAEAPKLIDRIASLAFSILFLSLSSTDA